MVETILNQPGSLCPAVKAADIIGDKWVLLILREFFLGATRYSDFQRAQPRMSPTILSKRLKQMEGFGLIIKKTSAGSRGKEYRLTKSGRELAPVVDSMAKWGLRWARRKITEENLDVGGFMWDFHRTIDVTELPDGDTVFCLTFTDQAEYKTWWVIAGDKVVELCTDDPGRDVDLYMSGTLPDFAAVWMGDTDIRTACSNEQILLTGDAHLTRTASSWFPVSAYSDVKPVRLVSVRG